MLLRVWGLEKGEAASEDPLQWKGKWGSVLRGDREKPGHASPRNIPEEWYFLTHVEVSWAM
jgi:hypothetical protein